MFVAICVIDAQEFEDAQDCMNAATNVNELYECSLELIDDADMDNFEEDCCECRLEQLGDIFEEKTAEAQDALTISFSDIEFDSLA
jgi:hypothetical protein